MKQNLYQRLLEVSFDKKIPLFAQIELTTECNLRCLHCYNPAKRRDNELTQEEFLPLFDQLAEMGSLFLSLTGGEILARPDFFGIAYAARKRGFALRLFTNGTLITPEKADKLKDLCPLKVEVSLYALKPGVHDGITGVPGSFARTMRAIKLLSQRNVPIAVKAIIMKENADEYGALKKFSGKIGAHFVYDYAIIPKINGSHEPLGHCMSDAQIENLLCDNFLKSVKKTTGHTAELPDKNNPVCGGGSNGVFVSSTGEVYPCVTWRVPLGNIRSAAFGEIWRSEPAQWIRKLTVGDMKKCANCSLFYLCHHCPGMALLETGDSLGASPTACRSARLKRDAIARAKAHNPVARSA